MLGRTALVRRPLDSQPTDADLFRMQTHRIRPRTQLRRRPAPYRHRPIAPREALLALLALLLLLVGLPGPTNSL